MNDYPIVVAGLRRLLAEHPARFEVVGAGTDLATLPTLHADVILFDTYGRDDDDLHLGHVLAVATAPVLVYSWAPASGPRGAPSHPGAAGFVSKHADLNELMHALEAAALGRPVPSAAHLDTTSTSLVLSSTDGIGSWPGHGQGLSARESEVLALIARGLSNSQIATALFLGENTIKTYIRSAYRKAGVATRARAILWALDHGFHPPDEPRPDVSGPDSSK